MSGLPRSRQLLGRPPGRARSAIEPTIETPFSFIAPAAGNACPCSGQWWQCGTPSHATTTTNSAHISVPGADATANTAASLRSEPSTDGPHPKDDSKVLRNRRVAYCELHFVRRSAAPPLRRSAHPPHRSTQAGAQCASRVARAEPSRPACPARLPSLRLDAHPTIGQRHGLAARQEARRTPTLQHPVLIIACGPHEAAARSDRSGGKPCTHLTAFISSHLLRAPLRRSVEKI